MSGLAGQSAPYGRLLGLFRAAVHPETHSQKSGYQDGLQERHHQQFVIPAYGVMEISLPISGVYLHGNRPVVFSGIPDERPRPCNLLRCIAGRLKLAPYPPEQGVPVDVREHEGEFVGLIRRDIPIVHISDDDPILHDISGGDFLMESVHFSQHPCEPAYLLGIQRLIPLYLPLQFRI